MAISPDTSDTSSPTAQALRDGIAAARAGQRDVARRLLAQVVEHDEHCAQAWLWLSGVVDSTEEREICLENVLTLDPQNRAALQGMAEVRVQKELRAAAPAAPEEPEPAPAASTALALENEYLCPACAAQTRPANRKCAACGQPLWTTSRQQAEQRASRIALAVTLQALCIVLNIGGLGVALYYVSTKLGSGDWLAYLRLYLGLPGAPAELADAAFATVPRLAVFGLLFFAALSALVLVGTFLRWKAAFFLFLVNGAWLGIAGVLATRLLWEAGSWGGDVGLAVTRIAMVVLDVAAVLVVFGLALEIRDDFFFDRQRLLLRLDRGTVTGPDFLVHGQRYLHQRQWAMAALHLKRAVDQMPDDLTANLQLGLVYGNLRRGELAARCLAEARRISPQDPHVAELAAWLERQRGGTPAGRAGR